jgi:hypothetical protein
MVWTLYLMEVVAIAYHTALSGGEGLDDGQTNIIKSIPFVCSSPTP